MFLSGAWITSGLLPGWFKSRSTGRPPHGRHPTGYQRGHVGAWFAESGASVASSASTHSGDKCLSTVDAK